MARANVLRWAYLLFHGGKITAEELARCVREFTGKRDTG